MPVEARYNSFEDDVPSFGGEMRREVLLDFEEGSGAFCNQGGYGICPKRVVEFRLDIWYKKCSDYFLYRINNKYLVNCVPIYELLAL